MRPVNYGLYNTLVLSCGFASNPPEAPLAAEKGAAWSFAVAFWSNLPVDLPATSVEVSNPADLKGRCLSQCRISRCACERNLTG